jgi:hypothetical protein
MGTGNSIPGVKQQMSEADLSPPSGAEVRGIVLTYIGCSGIVRHWYLTAKLMVIYSVIT